MSATSRRHVGIRPEWLATLRESPIHPEVPVVDAHHHLYARPDVHYLAAEFREEIETSGHDVRATVYVQARSMMRADGPAAMRPVGETEFANGVAAMAASGTYGAARLCAGIVGFADLTLGDDVRPLFEAHLAAGGARGDENGRFRGIRQTAVFDPDPALANPAYATPVDLLSSERFREGFAHLGALGLSFDAWLLFHQIPELTALARAFPETRIVLDHCGGIPGIGAYSGRRDEVFARWSEALADLAGCSNVSMKLGGLGMGLSGFGFEDGPTAPTSSELSAAWRPYMLRAVELFGTKRCMFESNFPVDKGSFAYGVGWNAMKRIAAECGADALDDLCWRSATTFYRLDVPSLRANRGT